MDLAGTVVNAMVVATASLLLAWYGRGRFEAIERRLDRLEDRLESVRSELTRRLDALAARMDAHIERHAG